MGDLTANLNTFEYLPKREYELHKKGILPIRILDWRLILADQKFIEYFGPMMINNWYGGRDDQFCGYRPYDCPIGAKYSSHRHGRGSDKRPLKGNWEEIAGVIRAKPELLVSFGYTTMEDLSSTKGWFHLEVGGNTVGKLEIVKP